MPPCQWSITANGCIGYPSETNLKIKSHEVSFVHTICVSSPIFWKIRTEHGSITAVLCAKFHNDWTREWNSMDKRDFTRLGFQMSFGWLSHIAQPHGRVWVNRATRIHNKTQQSVNRVDVSWDVIRTVAWWRHQIETFSALLALCAGNSPVNGEFPAERPVTRSFDVSLIGTWINAWVNNCEAADLRRHRVHYDVTVMAPEVGIKGRDK